jgi:hypothetical protein
VTSEAGFVPLWTTTNNRKVQNPRGIITPTCNFNILTAPQQFEATLSGAMSDIEVSKRIRILLANFALFFGWALKGACKPCAHRLFIAARWLVPEAQRFLLRRFSTQDRNRLSLKWLLALTQPRILAGFVVALAFWAALNFALRTTADDAQLPVDAGALQQASQASSKGNVVNVSKSLLSPDPVLETGSISAAQIATVPLPTRKPTRVRKVTKENASKANLIAE